MAEELTVRSAAYEVMRRMFEEGFATGNGDVVDELCSPELVEHQFGLEGATAAEALAHIKDAMSDVHRAIPDVAFTIEDAVERDGTIWMRARGRGTASGPFFGPPSGRRIDITVVDIARVEDGLIVEHWGVPDRFAMLAQTGVLERLS